MCSIRMETRSSSTSTPRTPDPFDPPRWRYLHSAGDLGAGSGIDVGATFAGTLRRSARSLRRRYRLGPSPQDRPVSSSCREVPSAPEFHHPMTRNLVTQLQSPERATKTRFAETACWRPNR
jgi:hypothetical protein